MKNTLDLLLKVEGISKSQLAKELGVSRQTIVRVSKGYPPSMELGLKIAQYFKKDVSDIFFIQGVKRILRKEGVG